MEDNTDSIMSLFHLFICLLVCFCWMWGKTDASDLFRSGFLFQKQKLFFTGSSPESQRDLCWKIKCKVTEQIHSILEALILTVLSSRCLNFPLHPSSSHPPLLCFGTPPWSSFLPRPHTPPLHPPHPSGHPQTPRSCCPPSWSRHWM